MKKYLFSLLALLSFAVYSQTDFRTTVREKEIINAPKGIKKVTVIYENRDKDEVDLHAYNKIESPNYFNDVVIQNTNANQRKVRVTTAFNGWVYCAFTIMDGSNSVGGITCRRSKDGGINWTTISTYSTLYTAYDGIDIVVAGTDTNNLTLYVAGIRYLMTPGTYNVFFNKYNATTGAFINNFANKFYGTRRVYDIDIASDYKIPAVGTSPYSIGAVYSVSGNPRDSVFFVASTNGGTSLDVQQTLFTTTDYCRHVSIDYGISSSFNNGRYFATWERLSTPVSRTGNIYVARNVSTINGAWTAPKNLDSLDAGMLGRCRRPEIAVQHNNLNNDSGNVSALILVDRDFGGTGTNYDVLGFYNLRSASNFNWKRLDVANTSNSDMQPHLVFDPGYNNFLAVYYDSTGGKLPYRVKGMNLVNPNSWTTITSQYNDLTTNLKYPWPRVDISPPALKAVHVWNSENIIGEALFDAEYLVTSFKDVYEPVITSDIYPNPAVSSFNLFLQLKNAKDVTMEIYDAKGQLMKYEAYNNLGNKAEIKTIDIDELANGVYIIKLTSNKISVSKKLVKAAN